MAISVNPTTYVISVPQADLTLVSGTLYELDTDDFRGWLNDWEDSEQGIVHPKTHDHFTTYTIAGVEYARAISILPPYSVTFEDGQYSVKLIGSNNNIWDIGGGILNQNQVQVIPTNSAGLVVVDSGGGGGGGLSLTDTLEGSISVGEALRIMLAATAGSSDGAGTATFEYLSVDGLTTRISATFDGNGNRQITLLDGD